MSSRFRNPKFIAVISVLGVLFIVGLAGGALGAEVDGGGFIGAPLAHIQLPAETVHAGYAVTNTMVATWLTILFLGVVSFLGTRRARQIPGRLQNVLEVVLEFFLGLAESVAGRENARRFFPLVVTIFLFVVTANWMGIVPGFGTIGRYEPAKEVIYHAEHKAEEEGKDVDLSSIKLQTFQGDSKLAILPFGSVGDEITAQEYEEMEESGEHPRAGLLVPFLRSANTDINTTLAIALVAMFMVHWWALRTLGFFGHFGKFLDIKGGPIGIFVGVLEAISEIARVISFTFRLFGNIFAGEVLLIAMAFLVPLIGLVPFLGLELFVGLIQAFIFAMLTLVFAATASMGHGADEHH